MHRCFLCGSWVRRGATACHFCSVPLPNDNRKRAGRRHKARKARKANGSADSAPVNSASVDSASVDNGSVNSASFDLRTKHPAPVETVESKPLVTATAAEMQVKARIADRQANPTNAPATPVAEPESPLSKPKEPGPPEPDLKIEPAPEPEPEPDLKTEPAPEPKTPEPEPAATTETEPPTKPDIEAVAEPSEPKVGGVSDDHLPGFAFPSAPPAKTRRWGRKSSN